MGGIGMMYMGNVLIKKYDMRWYKKNEVGIKKLSYGMSNDEDKMIKKL
jgi:hypothetical protein